MFSPDYYKEKNLRNNSGGKEESEELDVEVQGEEGEAEQEDLYGEERFENEKNRDEIPNISEKNSNSADKKSEKNELKVASHGSRSSEKSPTID